MEENNFTSSDLISKFKDISKRGFIKGINNSSNGAGLTFESLLGKKADSMYFPDYYDYEIKSVTRFSHFPITLFSITFDGPNLYEMNRILQAYGQTDFIYRDKKTLKGQIFNDRKSELNSGYKFKIDLDDQDKKMYLEVYDKNNNFLEKQSYIDYQSLDERLNLKLNKIALITSSKKEINGNKYYRYHKIELFKLKDFSMFLELIKKGIIEVYIECRISRSGSEAGRQRNKNILFKIKKENLNKLFKYIASYDSDVTNFNFI